MHFLRQIDCLEPGRERTHQLSCEPGWAAANACCEFQRRLLIAFATADGRDAIVLHELEQVLAALLPQDLANQSAKRVHVVAQRLVPGWKMDEIGRAHV